MRGVRHRWLVLTAGTALLVAGCNTSTCDRAEDSLVVQQACGVSARNTWFSSNYHDPSAPLTVDNGYQYFPPARTITFVHGLGSVPFVNITLAFSDNGSLATGAGNESLIECMDNQIIQIKNDTCSDFNVWVQAQGSGILSLKTCDGDSLVSPNDPACPVSADTGAAGASP